MTEIQNMGGEVMETSKQTAGKKSQKMMWTAIAFALLTPLILWYELENYHMHYNTGFLTELISMIGIVVNGWRLYVQGKAAARKEKQKISWGVIVCAVLSLAVCIAAYSVAVKIPTCVECDHITTEELGFLSRWISGIDAP